MHHGRKSRASRLGCGKAHYTFITTTTRMHHVPTPKKPVKVDQKYCRRFKYNNNQESNASNVYSRLASKRVFPAPANLNDIQNSPSTTRTGKLKLHCNGMCTGSYPDCGA
eukprot:6192236-Pleurochrysis_carterae.AAC.1